MLAHLSAQSSAENKALIDFPVKLAVAVNKRLENTDDGAQIARVIFALPFYIYAAVAPFRASDQATILEQPRRVGHRLKVCSFDNGEKRRPFAARPPSRANALVTPRMINSIYPLLTGEA